MATDHTVEQGENLTRIANQYGFRSYTQIWEHPKNETLRNHRLSPDILYPGDVVHIPEKEPFKRKLAIDKVHVIRVKRPQPDYIHFDVQWEDGETMDITRAVLVIEGREIEAEVKHSGIRVPNLLNDDKEAVLKVYKNPSSTPSYQIKLLINHQNPVETLSGVQSRLKALGFHYLEVTDELDDATEYALRVFQKRQGLDVTGEPDVATELALHQLSGL